MHRGLGVEWSFVRSVRMDVWRPDHIERMERGGNAKSARAPASRCLRIVGDVPKQARD